MENQPRLLSTIAGEIRATWVDKTGKPNVYFGAVPYLDAMQSLGNMDDFYGADSAQSIVAYFLANAGTWRGPDAQRIKTELREMSK